MFAVAHGGELAFSVGTEIGARRKMNAWPHWPRLDAALSPFPFVLAVRSKGCGVASVPTTEALGCGREDA